MKAYIIVLLFMLLFLSYVPVYLSSASNESNNSKLSSLATLSVEKLWEVSFQGYPESDLVIMVGTPNKVVLGTSLGIVMLNSSGIEKTLHIGEVSSRPVFLGGDIYAVSKNYMYIISSTGVLSKVYLEGIKSLSLWNNKLVINTISGGESTIMLYNTGTEFHPHFVVDYMLTGDIDGNGDGDLILVSKLGKIVAYALNGSVILNVTLELNTSYFEQVGFSPVIGDVDGDGAQEVLVPIVSLVNRAHSEVAIVGTSGVRVLSVSGGLGGLSVYDFSGDGVGDLFLGTSIWFGSVNLVDNTTIFNISTKGGEEGFSGPTNIADIDSDGAPEIMYIGGKGSIIIANTSGIERVLSLPSDSFFSYVIGNFVGSGTNIFAVSEKGTVKIFDGTGNTLASYQTISSALEGYYPTEFSGMFVVPLADGEILVGDKGGIVAKYGSYRIIPQVIYGDVDGDGVDEGIFVDSSGGGSKIYLIRPSNTTPLLFRSIDRVIYGFSVGDINGDGKDEIVANTEDKVYIIGESGVVMANISESLVGIPPAIYDINNDLKLDVVVVSQQKAIYTIYPNGTAKKLFGLSFIPETPLIVGDVDMNRGADYLTFHGDSMYCVGSSGGIEFIISKENVSRYPYPLITDFDADTFPDLVVSAGNKLSIFDHSGGLIKSIGFSENISGFTVVDLNSDWLQDAIVAMPGKIAIVDLVSGERLMQDLQLNIVGQKASLIVGDFDGTGETEVIVVSEGIAYLKINTSVRGATRSFGINKLVVFNTMNYDGDGDGLTLYDEIVVYHTNPYLKDTDGDGYSDLQEIENGWDPLDPNSPHRMPIFWISLVVSIAAIVVIIIISKWGFWKRKKE